MVANVETMAYRFANRSDVPWHGLGAPIGRDEYISAAEFQQRAGADWTISKRPVWWRPAPDKPSKQHPSQFVLQRDDNHEPLSIVSNQYKPVQNAEVFHFFHEFCERGHMTLETGGILDDGRIAWALAAINSGFTLANNDSVSGYLLLSDSRDGGALRAKFTPIRVVCCNTLALALSGKSTTGDFRLNHRTKFNAEVAKQALGISTDLLTKFKEQAEFLVSRPMSGLAFREFLERLFPPKEVIDDKGNAHNEYPRAFTYAMEAIDRQKGASMNPGTWWSGFNAITYMLDHNKSRISNDASRLTNSWFGAGNKLRSVALETALAMAK